MAESITLQTSDSDIVESDVLGRISFAASSEASGSDAILIGGGIYAEAESTFTAISNATSLVFSTASSESATGKLKISSGGHFLPLSNNSYDIGSSTFSFRTLYLATSLYTPISYLNSGTAALPSFTFSTDADTGIFSPSSNALGMSTGGTERIRIDSAGRVGIGTSTPSSTLHVIGSGLFSSGVNLNNQTASTIASFDANKNIVSLATATYPSLTELSYVKGVTSAIQTQLNGKQATITNPVTGTGSANHIAYWSSSSAVTFDNGQLYWDATNNRLGLGTSSPANTIHISAYNTSNSQLRVGSLEFQPYALNNGWIAENTYFNGSSFVRRSTGSAGLFYFQGSEGQFRFSSSDAAGTTVSPNPVWKIMHDGSMGVGAGMDFATGSLTNSKFKITANGGMVVGTEQGNYVTNGNHKAQIMLAAGTNASPLVLIGGNGGMEMWKDLGPSAACFFGMSVPGSAATNDFYISMYNGSWNNNFTILNSNGYVGIGTSSPTAKLHVNGSIKADNILDFPLLSITSLGSTVSFTNPTSTNSVDIIIPGQLELTRSSSGGGLWNSAVEASWDNVSYTSPADTEWNIDGWSNLSNIRSRTYNTFTAVLNNQIGLNVVGAELIMHHIPSDRYWKMNFTSWTQAAGGGGFAYDRTEIYVSDPYRTYNGNIACNDLYSSGTLIAEELNVNNAFTFPTSDGSQNQVLKTNGSGVLSWENDNNPVVYSIANGRLTLEQGVPFSTTNQTAKTTLYFTPYYGNQIALYNGSTWSVHTFTELSLSLSGYVANTNFDIFVYNNAGTLTLESTAWTNDSTRATALTTQDGVYVKSGATTRRYIGTIRTTATTGQCEDSESRRFVWNAHNQGYKQLKASLVGLAHTYTSITSRPWNNNTTVGQGRALFVLGLVSHIFGGFWVSQQSNASTNLALDSTTAGIDESLLFLNNTASPIRLSCNNIIESVSAGYHYLQLLENSTNGTSGSYNNAEIISQILC